MSLVEMTEQKSTTLIRCCSFSFPWNVSDQLQTAKVKETLRSSPVASLVQFKLKMKDFGHFQGHSKTSQTFFSTDIMYYWF